MQVEVCVNMRKQCVRMRLMPWSGNLLIEAPTLGRLQWAIIPRSLKRLYHTSVGMLRCLLNLQNHWMAYLDIHIYTWTTSVNHVADVNYYCQRCVRCRVAKEPTRNLTKNICMQGGGGSKKFHTWSGGGVTKVSPLFGGGGQKSCWASNADLTAPPPIHK